MVPIPATPGLPSSLPRGSPPFRTFCSSERAEAVQLWTLQGWRKRASKGGKKGDPFCFPVLSASEQLCDPH